MNHNFVGHSSAEIKAHFILKQKPKVDGIDAL